MKFKIGKSDCIKFESLISSYFKNILSANDKNFFKKHFEKCVECQQKFLLMKKIYQNFKKINTDLTKDITKNKDFSINEYKLFTENISAYIDGELSDEENLIIKKLLIKNDYAKKTFLSINNLIFLEKKSFDNYKNKISVKEEIRNLYFHITKFK